MSLINPIQPFIEPTYQSSRHSKKLRRSKQLRYVRVNYELYLLLIPVIIHLAIFSYYTMYGAQIAFRDFNPVDGFFRSPWVGLRHVRRFLNSPHFFQTLRNTMELSVYSLIIGFPLPIIMALILNQMANQRYKRFIQTVLYAPNFISVVVIVGMILIFLSPYQGPINGLIRQMGGNAIHFMGIPEMFSSIYVWSGVWQSAGWGMIIYLAALSGVSPELHEAAIIDGATKVQRICYVDLPTISPTIVILLILSLGSLVSVGFEKAFLMQNAMNISRSEVIATFVYKRGLAGGEFSFASAVGLLNTLVNFVLLILVNQIAKRVSETSLW